MIASRTIPRMWVRYLLCASVAAVGLATYPPTPDGSGRRSRALAAIWGSEFRNWMRLARRNSTFGRLPAWRITHIVENGPAAKAGFKVGDVVLEFGGEKVEGLDQFMRLVRETPAGKAVKLGLFRSGTNRNVALITGVRKVSSMRELEWNMSGIDAPEVSMPDVPRTNMTWRSSFLGVDVERPDPQLAEYFGVKDGVLVRSVNKGSAAERAGHSGRGRNRQSRGHQDLFRPRHYGSNPRQSQQEADKRSHRPRAP